MDTTTDLEAAISLAGRLNHPWGHTEAPLGILAEAADAVHAVHYSWARTAEPRSWRDCYTCQTYAMRAVEVAYSKDH